MTIDKHVTSLELSKRLHELGVKKGSIFYWGETLTDRHGHTEFNIYFNDRPVCNILMEYPAYLASELLEIIPANIFIKELEPFGNYRLKICRSLIKLPNEKIDMYFNYVYSINYHCDSTEITGEDAWLERKLFPPILDENFANACALMRIYLIEQGHVKI